MNSFFQEEFHISNILICLYVQPENAKLVHNNRPSHGLVVMAKGEGHFRFANGSELHAQEGQLFYLPKASSYTVTQAGACIAVNFDLSDVDRTYPPFVVGEAHQVKYLDLMQSLLQAWDQNTSAHLHYCYAKLYELIYCIQKEAAKRYQNPKTRRTVSNAASVLAQNVANPDFAIGDLAKDLGVTPEYFRKVFAQSYGSSPKAYLLQLRIERAKALLRSGEFRVVAIAGMCGYADESYFCKEFKRITGQTPTQYANEIEKKRL